MPKTTKKTQTGKEITPATLDAMPIGGKMQKYEQLLSDKMRLQTELETKRQDVQAILEPTGQSFSDYYKEDSIRVMKKRKVDKQIKDFASKFGNYLQSILANGTTADASFEKYMGKDAYAKLKTVADEYSIQQYGEKNIDEEASKKVWEAYKVAIDEYHEIQKQLTQVDREMDQADQYVNYVQKLAEVARKAAKFS